MHPPYRAGAARGRRRGGTGDGGSTVANRMNTARVGAIDPGATERTWVAANLFGIPYSLLADAPRRGTLPSTSSGHLRWIAGSDLAT